MNLVKFKGVGIRFEGRKEGLIHNGSGAARSMLTAAEAGAAGSHKGEPPGMSKASTRRSLTAEESRVMGRDAEVEAARAEAMAAKESAAMELAVLRHQLAKAQQALAQAEQVL